MAERKVIQVETVEEVWETTGHATIYVRQTTVDGSTRNVAVGGRPGMRLRISEYDRERNQETVMDEAADPFTNGMLIRVLPEGEAGPQHLTDDQIAQLFMVTGQEFTDKVDELNEYNVRRMYEKAYELDATNSQIQTLKGMIETKWPIGGDTPMYRELKGLGQVAAQDH